jgi:hypothetical protein
MSTILYEDAWAVVSLDASRGLVRYTRTALAYGSLVEVARSFDGVRGIGTRITPGLKLLVDVRLAPPRNDPAFESRSMAALQGLAQKFTRVATLVRTAVGKLQTTRLAKERGTDAHAFDDEAAALAYLDVV